MAWRPSDWVLEGELDNTQLGWTIGWMRIQGRDEPLKLKLAGNCHPDLAGWKFRIVRTDPIPDWAEELQLAGIATDQTGTIGDVTADQMIKHFECSPKEFVERSFAGDQPATTWRKCLYLEWYSHRNGRVVIQSTCLAVQRVGERAFELTQEQWVEQAKQNSEEMTYFMHQLGDALSDKSPDEDEEPDPPTG
jgi:hypothetical protein